MSDIIRETERLHLVYASEIKKKQEKFDAAMKKLADEEKAINATDYLKEYVDTYRVSLSALEEIFADWDSVQRRTKGVTFTVGEYIKRLSPRPVPKGGVFEYVDRLVEEGRAAITEVGESKTVEGDIAPQKSFCQCLTDLRYVVMSSRRLLAETGYEVRKREEALTEVNRKKADLEADFYKKTKLENLSCYKELEALKAQILSDNEKASTMLIGKPLSDDETDYRFLIGFKKSNISKEALNFAVKTLGVPEKALSGVPVFFEPKTRNGVIVVRADRDYLEAEGGDDFGIIRKIYFSILSSLGPKNLRLGGAETAFESVVGAVADRVKAKLGESYIFDKDIASSPSGTIAFVESLKNFIRGRSSTYNGNDYKSIYEYNENTPDAKHDFVLAVYNYAPDCFGERFTPEQKKTFMEVLEKGPSRGVFSLIRVDKDSDFTLESKDKKVSHDVIDVTENGVLYNGEPISVDIMVENFRINDYLDYLSKQNKTSDSLSLKKLLKMSDKDFAVKPVEDYNDALRIPLGISDGVRYDYVLKTCLGNVFGLLVGMTGSGKSAFLHTFIMSAAYNYAPDELQMYLVDFKSGETSPAFANYKKGNPMYLPHVVYLSLRCREESAMDLLNKIDFMIDERAKIMTDSKTGGSDIRAFNKSQAVLSGEYKKIPIALFIIDEYNNMFSATKNFQMRTKLEEKLKSVLKRGRTSGIEILFCGQDSDPFRDCGAIDQIGSKLSLKVNNPGVFNSFFRMDAFKANEYAEKLKKIGTALISTSDGAPSIVKVAYAGETTSQDIKDVAARIREKYKDNPACNIIQTEAGNDDLFPISDYKAVAYNEEKYDLPIGASASNTIGVCMSFSEDRNATGFCALARESKLFELERSFTLSYIDSYIEKFDDGEFIYAAGPADGKEFIDGFGREKDFVSKFVNVCADKEHLEIARELTRLKELLEKRREERSLDNKAKFKPVYLVIHDVEWLLSSGTIGGKKAASEATKAAEAPAKPVDTSATEKALADSGVSLKGGALAMLSRVRSGGSTVQPKVEKPVEDNKTYYISDLKSIVSDLYEKGSGFCIFVILTHETLSELKSVRGNGANADSSERYIYDSYDVLKAITENKSIVGVRVDETCVYDNLSSTRTRLFDYSVENNAEWWKALKAKRG